MQSEFSSARPLQGLQQRQDAERSQNALISRVECARHWLDVISTWNQVIKGDSTTHDRNAAWLKNVVLDCDQLSREALGVMEVRVTDRD